MALNWNGITLPTSSAGGGTLAGAYLRRRAILSRAVSMAGAGGSFGPVAAAVVAAAGTALLPRGLQRPFGEGARGLLGVELLLERGEPFLERLALGADRLVLLGDPPFDQHDLPFGALQRGVLGLQRLGKLDRALIERRADRIDFPMQRARRVHVLLKIGERHVFGLQRKRGFERPLLETANLGVAFAQRLARFGQEPLGGF